MSSFAECIKECFFTSKDFRFKKEMVPFGTLYIWINLHTFPKHYNFHRISGNDGHGYNFYRIQRPISHCKDNHNNTLKMATILISTSPQLQTHLFTEIKSVPGSSFPEHILCTIIICHSSAYRKCDF